MGGRIWFWFIGLLLLVMVTACGDGDNGGPAAPVIPPGDNESEQQVVLTLLSGWWEGTGDEVPLAKIPEDVAGVRLTVMTAAGTVSRDTTLAQGDLRAEFSITLQAGTMTRFTMEAVDAGDELLYRGAYFHQVVAQADSFFLTMVPVSDTTAPDLSDNLTVVPRSNHDLELIWDPALIGRETDSLAAYLVWATQTSQTPTILPTAATGTGQNIIMLGDLQPGVSYDIVVRAVDRAGNVSDGTARQTCTMPIEGGDLYVDVNTGQDGPDRGGPDNPFKTITYALSRTDGNVVIFISQGTYDSESGEVFPLQLKPGIRLVGELQFGPLYPLTRLVIEVNSSTIVGAGWNFLSGLELVNRRDDHCDANFIDARVSDLSMQFMVFDGNGGYMSEAVQAGQWALIHNSIFKDLPQGSGIYVLGDEYSHVRSCWFHSCGSGVAASGSHVQVAGCKMYDCIWGVNCGSGEDFSILHNTMRGCENGLILTEMNNSLVAGCQILGSSSMGIQLTDCTSSLRISSCLVQNEEAIGIFVRRGSVTLFQNILSCNRTNLYVDGPDLVIADRNSWRHNPPDIRTRNQGMGLDGFCDISYDQSYSGTPMPVWEPCLGVGGCEFFMINPLLAMGRIDLHDLALTGRECDR